MVGGAKSFLFVLMVSTTSYIGTTNRLELPKGETGVQDLLDAVDRGPNIFASQHLLLEHSVQVMQLHDVQSDTPDITRVKVLNERSGKPTPDPVSVTLNFHATLNEDQGLYEWEITSHLEGASRRWDSALMAPEFSTSAMVMSNGADHSWRVIDIEAEAIIYTMNRESNRKWVVYSGRKRDKKPVYVAENVGTTHFDLKVYWPPHPRMSDRLVAAYSHAISPEDWAQLLLDPGGKPPAQPILEQFFNSAPPSKTGQWLVVKPGENGAILSALAVLSHVEWRRHKGKKGRKEYKFDVKKKEWEKFHHGLKGSTTNGDYFTGVGQVYKFDKAQVAQGHDSRRYRNGLSTWLRKKKWAIMKRPENPLIKRVAL